jgi:hypothetical protein
VRKLQLNSFASFFLPLNHLKILADKDTLSVIEKEHFMGIVFSSDMLIEFDSDSLNF